MPKYIHKVPVPTSSPSNRVLAIMVTIFSYSLSGLKKLTSPQADDDAKDEGPAPDCVYQLESRVWNNDVTCTCDICQSVLYSDSKCPGGPHQKIKLHEHHDVNKYGYTVYQPPLLDPRRKKVQLGSTHLPRTIVEYFDRLWEYLNDRQLLARESLLKWVSGRRDFKAISLNGGAEIILDNGGLRQLWKSFSELFFGVDVGDSKIK
jgi:hypothetical protein